NGVGQAEETAFRVPIGSIGYWTQRLIEKGVPHQALEKRFGEPVLAFTDPDGMSLALVGVAGAAGAPALGRGVPPPHRIRGFHRTTWMRDRAAPTGAILTNALGFKEVGREGPLVRYATAGTPGSVVTIRETGGFLPARMGRGSVHHIAFRAADDSEQAA